ncbi:hypothetical protein AWC38_SpisGene12101 [Stylophora pistillata]|uniref:Uncharacterized protein n=2 Tax=Stylophora pistillata TaxID=50429 RepID=A0A2B4RY25_STYPI|nr:hypothetical protein AWC38_SpisGene12101 [Stylophora pistillata]
MHSNRNENKVSLKSNIPVLQSSGRTLTYSSSSSSANISSDHNKEQWSGYGVTEVQMQSSKEALYHGYVPGGRQITYSVSATTNSHVGRKMDSCGVIDESEQKTKRFTGEGHLFGQTMVYSSTGGITSSQAAGRLYRQDGNEGGMRTSKDSGFGENDSVSQLSGEIDGSVTEEFPIELNENEEEALKEELLHIFERERTTLEVFFKKKMEETLRGFRSRQLEWDEATRAERAELEKNVSMEKMEMQKNFAEEIDKLTQSFREERQQLDQYYKEQLQELREKLGTEQERMGENFAREKIELKEKLEAEYQVMLEREISHVKQEAIREKSEVEQRLNNEKGEIERNFNLRFTEVESNLERSRVEFEANMTQERIRMEKEFREKSKAFEDSLQEERLLRLDREKELEQEREKSVNGESMSRNENERLQKEIEVLRLEIEEKNSVCEEITLFQEAITLKGREGLSGKLKDDFEKLLADHKTELDKTFHIEKEALDQKVQSERRKIQEELDQEKEKIKVEKDEIVKTRERLQVEGKGQVDNLQMQRNDSEWTRSSLGHLQNGVVGETDSKGVFDHQAGVGSGAVGLSANRGGVSDGVSDVTSLSYWQSHQHSQQEQSQKEIMWTGAYNTGSHAVQHGFTGSQQKHDGASNVAGPSYWQSYQQPQHPQKDSEGTGASATSSHLDQPAVSGSYGQLVGSDHSTKNDSTLQSHYHASLKYHENQALARNSQVRLSDSGNRSMDEHQVRSMSFCHTPTDNESALRFEIDALKSENKGLKAKIVALEENIDLHKQYKEEAKAEMERLLKANQDKDLRVKTLTSQVEETEKLKTEKEDDRKRLHTDQTSFSAHAGGGRRLQNTDRHLEEKLRTLEVRAAKAEKTSTDYDTKTRLTTERSREQRRHDSNGHQVDIRGQRSVSSSRQKEGKSHYELKPRYDDTQDSSYKTKYEATLREKNRLIQVTKELELKIKTLKEKQAELLQTSYQENSLEKRDETERLKRLVSENSSLRERTSELQNQLERLLEKLKNEKEKATSLETKISTRKTDSLHNIKGLEERLLHTGRELSSSRGELDPDALKRIEREIVAIGQIIRTQFEEGSREDLSHTSVAKDSARIAHLEVEKKELETKLSLAREAMHEYVARLNEKMQDVESMAGMSGEMIQELHTRNNNLEKSLQDLEDEQKTSHLQNEQLRHQKSVLQNLIGDLCSHDELTATSYNSSPRYYDSEHKGRSYDDKESGEASYSASPNYLDSTYKSKYATAHDKGRLDSTPYNTSSKFTGFKSDDKGDGNHDNRYKVSDSSLEDSGEESEKVRQLMENLKGSDCKSGDNDPIGEKDAKNYDEVGDCVEKAVQAKTVKTVTEDSSSQTEFTEILHQQLEALKGEFQPAREEMEKEFIKEKDYLENKLRNEYIEIIKAKDDLIRVLTEEKDFFLKELRHLRKSFDLFTKHVHRDALQHLGDCDCLKSLGANLGGNGIYEIQGRGSCNGNTNLHCEEFLSVLRKQEEVLFKSFEREKAEFTERFEQDKMTVRKLTEEECQARYAYERAYLLQSIDGLKEGLDCLRIQKDELAKIFEGEKNALELSYKRKEDELRNNLRLELQRKIIQAQKPWPQTKI